MTNRPYGTRTRQTTSTARERILGVVRTMLEEGTFHAATIEEVATRAGVSRATLYQHFRSRSALVEAVCETFSTSPTVAALQAAVTVSEFLRHIVEFWETQERLLTALAGVAAIDPAARSVLDDLAADRANEVRRVVRTVWGRRRSGEQSACALLSWLSSFETYVEFRRRAGMPADEVVSVLESAAQRLLGV